MIYTRNVKPNNVLSTIRLSTLTDNPIRQQLDLLQYAMFLETDMLGPYYIIPVSELFGYTETPDRYWTQINTNMVCVYVEPKLDNSPNKFVWNDENALTLEIKSPSIVFLKVDGKKLSYESGDKEKLLFLECAPVFSAPIKIAFFDNYGLPQVIKLQTGNYGVRNESTGTFRSLSSCVKYDVEKIPEITLTAGDNSLPRQLNEYLTGFSNSEAYVILSGKLPLKTHLLDINVSADSFTKRYSVGCSVQIEPEDLDTINNIVGEINLHQ